MTSDLKERKISEYSDLYDWQNPYGGDQYSMHFLFRQTVYLEYENFKLFLPDVDLYNSIENNPEYYSLCFTYKYFDLNSIEAITNFAQVYIKTKVTGAYILDKNKDVVYIDRQYE